MDSGNIGGKDIRILEREFEIKADIDGNGDGGCAWWKRKWEIS